MILDSSAIVAVLVGEPGCEALERRMREADVLAVGAPTLFETAMVMIGKGGASARGVVERFCASLEVVTVPYGVPHAEVAIDAFTRFGKGRHAAGLNILDCMTYATARVADEPLLYVGNDFARTDIAPA